MRFRIRYIDPKTQQPEIRDCEFEDWSDVIAGQSITARQWAEDLGYTLTDKGHFQIEILS